MNIKLSLIRCDAGTQSRAETKEETVSEYAERMAEGDVFPPVVVFTDGNEYFLADGFHRILAAYRNGLDSFKCDVRKGTAVDALWFAIGANATNGARRTTADKRKAIELALVKFPEKTQEQVAKHVGCVQSYVAKIRSEIITSDIHKLPDTRRSSDGKSRPTTYKKHAKPASSIREEIENRTKKPEPVPEPREVSGTPASRGMMLAAHAVKCLESIPQDDPERDDAFDHVVAWIAKQPAIVVEVDR